MCPISYSPCNSLLLFLTILYILLCIPLHSGNHAQSLPFLSHHPLPYSRTPPAQTQPRSHSRALLTQPRYHLPTEYIFFLLSCVHLGSVPYPGTHSQIHTHPSRSQLDHTLPHNLPFFQPPFYVIAIICISLCYFCNCTYFSICSYFYCISCHFIYTKSVVPLCPAVHSVE